ncbi:sterol O-acyltransferase 1 [Drosophila grimshawi]|uniref:O-acyltransferase n=1 Tax=Drosophila grimshawi TaxID=7222 RepID=B4JI01_DROGR|nr:sterol O-acyltransferase 1 [Drosophila grimshawi]EDV92909.1 GH18571 [Drosophila grimshawi]
MSEEQSRTMETDQIHFVREKLQKFQSKMLLDFDQRLSCLIEDVLQDIRQQELRAHEFRHFDISTSRERGPVANATWHNRRQLASSIKSTTDFDVIDYPNGQADAQNETTKAQTQQQQQAEQRRRRQLPDKVFVTRESYLTALLQVEHMRTIYHIFGIILVMFLLNVICYDYFVEGNFNLGLGTFRGGLKRLHWVMGVWLLEHIFVLTLFYAFQGWAVVRAKLQSYSSLQRFWSHSCLILYVSAQLVFGYVSTSLCLKFQLPFVSACVLLLESTRLLMKMHAFVRYNAERVLLGKQKTDDDDLQHPARSPYVPPLHCYVYFLFAPTLIYRDSYPRTSHIRWKFALCRLLEIVAIAFLYAFIHERHIHEHFGKIGKESLGAPQLIVKFFGMILPSAVIFLCGFYMILHSWLNFTSELLRFGDRMFYKDWWTSHTYDSYYRNWNVVVHDWLYEYVYRDVYRHIFKGSKLAASLLVFMISALVHEQVLGFALQVFFPVMFVLFGGVGVALVFLMRRAPKKLGNILLWFSLISGNGMLISLYAMEYYAKRNCQLEMVSWSDYLTPAIWRCYH